MRAGAATPAAPADMSKSVDSAVGKEPSGVMDASKGSAIGAAAVASPAGAAAEPSAPKVLLNTLLSIFLGVLLAVGVALLLELTDRRVRSADDVVAALDLPVLGTLPKPNAKRFTAGHRALPAAPRAMALAGPTSSTQGA